MPIRFHRQFTLFPGVKVNVSKTGMSITLGGKGFHLNLSKRGVMQTTNLPGKGLSHRSYILKNEGDNESKEDDEEEKRSSSEGKAKRRKRTHEGTNLFSLGFFPLFDRCFVLYLLRRAGLRVITPKPLDRFIKHTHAMGAAGGAVIL